MSGRPNLPAPTPLRNRLLSSLSSNLGGGTDVAGDRDRLPRSSSTTDISGLKSQHPVLVASRTPEPLGSFGSRKAAQQTDDNRRLFEDRLKRYNLDYPEDYKEYWQKALDKDSRWFSRKSKRKLNLCNLIPYSTESHKDQAKYICHILVHLYIAIKSMDLEGLVSISTKDLSLIRNDIELTLDTDFFNADLSFDIENDEDEEAGDEEDDEVKSSGVIGKIMPRSAAVISVNHWTNELKTCLKMKFEIPLRLRASLAKVYYYLSLTTGQAVQTTLFIDMFVKLTFKYVPLLCENKALVLNHHDLLEKFSQFFPDPDSAYNVYSIHSDSDKAIFDLYLRLSIRANYFFELEAMRDIFDFCTERISTSTYSLSVKILAHALPIRITKKESILKLIPSFFYLWLTYRASATCELHVTDLLGRIAKDLYDQVALGLIDADVLSNDNGIFTDSQLEFILNSLQKNLRVEQRISSFHGIAKILVYSITSKSSDKIANDLEVLLSSLETYVHPSNAGKWASSIARFCNRFLFRYHKRYRFEQREDECYLPDHVKLNSSINDKIFKHFKNVVIVGSQSKANKVTAYFVECLEPLCDIPSSLKSSIINKVLIEVYDSLTDQFINSSQRIIVSLRQFTQISSLIITDKVYRVHVTNILSLLLSKVGTNDLQLTNCVFNALVTAISLVQIEDLSKEEDFVSFESTTSSFIQDHLYFIKEHPDEAYEVDSATIRLAFIASTQAFRSIIKSFVDSYIKLLEADIDEKILNKLSQIALVFTQSLSPKMFSYYAELVEGCLFNGDLTNENENESLLANLVASVVKRDPTRAKNLFLKLSALVRTEIDQGAGQIRNDTHKILGSDKMLVMYLSVLSEVLSGSFGEVVEFKKEYLEFIAFLYKSVPNPSIQGCITYIIHKTLKNLTNIKLKESYIFQYEPPADDIEARWGLNHRNESRFDEDNLQFDWYVPSIIEVGLAVEIFETIVIESLSKIEELSSVLKDSDFYKKDELIKNLLYLNNCLSGSSMLFDPDFASDENDDDFNKLTLEKKLLILKSLRASRGEDKELTLEMDVGGKKDAESSVASTPMKEGDSEDTVNLNSEVSWEDLSSTDRSSSDTTTLSSRVITPSVPHESDSMSVMNPKVAFRATKIYNCNYFFGSTSVMKRKFTSYGQIHSLRSLIGQSLHTLAVRLRNNAGDNIKVLQTLLLTIRAFFCDVGKESSFDLDDELFIDYNFLKDVQSINNYSKPFTRVALGARIEKYHRQRTILHSTNRFMTKLEKLLLTDIVIFSTSAYSSIYQPAQMVMVDGNRKLIGSYSYCIQVILKLLSDMIKIKDYKRLEAGLRIFRLKRMSNKVVHDYKNIEEIAKILCQCLKLDDDDINEAAQKCLDDFGHSIQVPSAVALLNIEEIDSAIRPPDKNIDLEISTVKSAKNIKREKYYEYLNNLQDFLIEQEENNTHWKTSLLHLKFLLNLGDYYELKTKSKVFELLVARAKSNHPSLVRLCVRAVSKIVHKISSFAIFEHSLEKSFAIGYSRKALGIVDTSDNYVEKFEKELMNFEKPNYFIDTKPWRGGFCWGKSMYVLKNEPEEVVFNDEDVSNLSSIGKLITSDWLNSILKVLAQENEVKGVFQATDVSLIKTIVQLNYYGYSSISYEKLLGIVTEHYDKDQKESVIICCEMVCGLLTAAKYNSPEEVILRDEFLTDFLENVLSTDLTPESSSVWNIMFWLVADKIDIRRIPILLKKTLDLASFIDIDSNKAFLQSARISFLNTLLTALISRFSDYEPIIQKLVLTHPYTLVRNSVASLLALFCTVGDQQRFNSPAELISIQGDKDFGSQSLKTFDKFNKYLIEFFDEAESLRAKAELLSPQEQLETDYFYLSHTLFRVLKIVISSNSHAVVSLMNSHIAPFLMRLLNNKDLCKLGELYPDVVFRRLGEVAYYPCQINDLMTICLTDYTSMHECQLQLGFIEAFYSRSILLLTSDQKNLIVNKIDKLIFNNFIEVRNAASQVLSGIIHSSNGLDMIDHLIRKYNRIISKHDSKKARTNEQSIKLHGATVGVGALISAFPYTSPPPEWLPKEISVLAKASSITGIVGKAAKDILSTFKKLRADTWHIDREYFNEEQLEDLEGVLWRSYFA